MSHPVTGYRWFRTYVVAVDSRQRWRNDDAQASPTESTADGASGTAHQPSHDASATALRSATGTNALRTHAAAAQLHAIPTSLEPGNLHLVALIIYLNHGFKFEI